MQRKPTPSRTRYRKPPAVVIPDDLNPFPARPEEPDIPDIIGPGSEESADGQS